MISTSSRTGAMLRQALKFRNRSVETAASRLRSLPRNRSRVSFRGLLLTTGNPGRLQVIHLVCNRLIDNWPAPAIRIRSFFRSSRRTNRSAVG